MNKVWDIQQLDLFKEIEYEYINIEEVPGTAAEVTKINNGYQSIPTIVFPNGKILIEPSNIELEKVLEENELPRSKLTGYLCSSCQSGNRAVNCSVLCKNKEEMDKYAKEEHTKSMYKREERKIV